MIDNGNANEEKKLPYKMENTAETQPWSWEEITKVLTMDIKIQKILHLLKTW